MKPSLLHALLALALSLAGAGCPEPPPPPPRTPTYTVHLTEVGPNQAKVVTAVASLRGGTEALAKRLLERKTEGVSLPVATGLDRAAADAAAAALAKEGAEVKVVEVP